MPLQLVIMPKRVRQVLVVNEETGTKERGGRGEIKWKPTYRVGSVRRERHGGTHPISWVSPWASSWINDVRLNLRCNCIWAQLWFSMEQSLRSAQYP